MDDRSRLPSQARPPSVPERDGPPPVAAILAELARLVDRIIAQGLERPEDLAGPVEAMRRSYVSAEQVRALAGPSTAILRNGLVLVPPSRGSVLYRQYRYLDLDGVFAAPGPGGADKDEGPATYPAHRDRSTKPGPGRE